MSISPIKVVSPQAQKPLQASKWLSIQVLLELDELKSLFQALDPFYIFKVGVLCEIGQSEIDKDQFLAIYQDYIESLKNGELPDENSFKTAFSSILTVDTDHLYAIENQEKQLIRIAKPVIQLQSHRMDYSTFDHQFRPMVFGQETLFWGLQFSFPQITQDAVTKEIIKIKEDETFPNAFLFKRLQRWMRNNTRPTPFIIQEKIVNIPMRLGKQCFAWINQHPQFSSKGLKVAVRYKSEADNEN